MANGDPELDVYNYYLGVFVFLGLGLVAICVGYQLTFPGYPARYPTWGSVVIAFFLPIFFSQTHYLLSDHTTISLAAKKIAVIVAFVFYVISASLLTMWGGGAVSAAANLLVLTSTLSIYVATQSGTKWWIGIISLLCYLVVSVYRFDHSTGAMVFSFNLGMVATFVTVVFIVIVSAVTSREIANRQRAVPVKRDE